MIEAHIKGGGEFSIERW